MIVFVSTFGLQVNATNLFLNIYGSSYAIILIGSNISLDTRQYPKFVRTALNTEWNQFVILEQFENIENARKKTIITSEMDCSIAFVIISKYNNDVDGGIYSTPLSNWESHTKLNQWLHKWWVRIG